MRPTRQYSEGVHKRFDSDARVNLAWALAVLVEGDSMKRLYGVFALIFLPVLPCLGSALPDSCGTDQVRFDVDTQKAKPPSLVPPDGKAQIVLIENENYMIGALQYATVRFGLDGGWLGADRGSSYFFKSIEPGVHHLCASWQSARKRLKKNVDLTSFTAEAGKTYFFQAEVNVESEYVVHFALSELNEDKGRFLINSFKTSTFRQK